MYSPRIILVSVLLPTLTAAVDPAIAAEPFSAEGDYWVEPMRVVHRRFQGTPGTLAQFGDSITVTMAFLAPYSWGNKIEPKNCSPEVRKELDCVQDYANRKLWREWKGGEWGNTGSMMSDWLRANVDSWQKKMRPETAVILFGTNDLGRLPPAKYADNMKVSLRRILADGTIPLLTTVPPFHGADERVKEYNLGLCRLAEELKIPVIDYYREILQRRPNDWDGALDKFRTYKDVYEVPTLISGDGVHPSNQRAFQNDFSRAALDANGYNLRNYLTLRRYAQVIDRVLQGKPLR